MESAKNCNFTSGGPASVERRIAEDQARVGAAVRAAIPAQELVALILAGGYGRGEGGFRERDGQPVPYNDYDYFVVIRGRRRREKAVAEVLKSVAHALECDVGVEVDFAVLRESKLSKLPFTLMNAELKNGHKVVVGEPRVLERMPPMPVDQVPLGEFSRLLLNRGSLLLMNRQVLAAGGPRTDAEREKFSRYLDKALLACADARLAAVGRYHDSYVVKRERLENLRWQGSRDFIARYERAVQNRCRPTASVVPAGQERTAQSILVADWLEALAEIETARLGKLPDWREYSSARVAKGQSPRGPGALARNLAITMRDFGIGEVFRNASWSMRYPRERLISVLPALLEPALPVPTAVIAGALSHTDHYDSTSLASRFIYFWNRYN